jgi:hypothetical protein
MGTRGEFAAMLNTVGEELTERKQQPEKEEAR